MQRISIIDSHTEGEPTRVVLAGGPELGRREASDSLRLLRQHHDWLRSAAVREPRGADFLVGAWLAPPSRPEAVAQAVFFNNVGYLGMCVHATIGVARTLAFLGRVDRGSHWLETPAGLVRFSLLSAGRVEVENVLSYRYRAGARVETEAHGEVVGDVAYGGNWFFLCREATPAIGPARIDALTALALDIRRSLVRQGITGRDGAEIDHVELFGPPSRTDADSRNFVLCPGAAYDRSPCGTGTSAKIACLAADGALQEGQVWRQESVVGSLFEGTFRRVEGGVIPKISGRAFLTAESSLILDENDPFARGIPA